jgi:hypothetical protein
MDEPNYQLPAWLPWATTACLAALAACLVELWVIERSRGELLREQAELAQSAATAAQNQLEAERILNARQLRDLGDGSDPQAALQVFLLEPAERGTKTRAVAVIDAARGRGQLRLFGAPAQADDRDYQLWIEGPGPITPANCGVFHRPEVEGEPVRIYAPIVPGSWLVLVECPKGGTSALVEAKARASIVLASLPYRERNLGR